MDKYKTEGIIIKKTNLGEVDRLLTVYSKEFGKIVVKAKSVRKNQAKLKGHLELFFHSHLILVPARGWPLVVGAEALQEFSLLHNDLFSLAAAYYFSELLDRLIVGPERDENIWQLVLTSFTYLNQNRRNIQQVIRIFEDTLLNLLGYGRPSRPVHFIESLLQGELKSKYFLQKTRALLE